MGRQRQVVKLASRARCRYQVAGALHHQAALWDADWRIGAGDRHVIGQFVCERDNPFDANAVGVYVFGALIGYLPACDASGYREELAGLGFAGRTASGLVYIENANRAGQIHAQHGLVVPLALARDEADQRRAD